MWILIEVIDPGRIEAACRRMPCTAYLFQQQLRQVAAVLTSDARDQSVFAVAQMPLSLVDALLPLGPCVRSSHSCAKSSFKTICHGSGASHMAMNRDLELARSVRHGSLIWKLQGNSTLNGLIPTTHRDISQLLSYWLSSKETLPRVVLRGEARF